MRLKKLVLHGFKSFADRTEFLFDQAITCVVGPNGCGKSNVVDAIKWVLGEQSAKSLRGGAMLDVIFNGADTRKPLGMAEVELVFHNPPKPDGTRYLALDTDDVSVTRRLYRDGTSEYLINNQGGRLKDIRELFLDTGIGVDAYSIIEQGRVARLLDANPQERRQIFEEAAGISRFKVRKKEAERKLEKVDQNLARLNDINGDLERRLRGVRIQAGRARTYQELADRLSELRLQHALHEYHTLFTKLAELRKSEEDTRFALDDSAGQLTRQTADLAARRQDADELAQARQRTSNELIETRGKIQAARQQADYARKQQAQIQEQSVQLAGEHESSQARLLEVESMLAEVTTLVADLVAQLASQRSDIDAQQQQHRQDQLRANDINREIDQHKLAMLDAMRKLAGVESRLSSIVNERKNAAAQQERMSARRQQLADEHAQAQARHGELEAAVHATLAQIADLNAQAQVRAEEASSLSASIKQLTERLGSAREQRSGLLSRQRTLSEMEARREGVSESVQWVLKHRQAKFPFIRGLVADVLRVDVEHAHVIESALDGRDQWLIADPSVHLIEHRQAFEELSGRVNVLRVDPYISVSDSSEHLSAESAETSDESDAGAHSTSFADIQIDTAVSVADDKLVAFVPQQEDAVIEDARMVRVDGTLVDTLSQVGPVEGSALSLTDEVADVIPIQAMNPDEYDWTQHTQQVRLAVDLVKYEPADRLLAEHLLGRTAIVQHLDDALSLHQHGPHGWRFVTAAGDVVEADGTFRTGPLGASMSILSRRSELDALAHQVNDIDARIAGLQQELAAGNDQARQMDQAIAALRQEVYKLNTTKVEQSSQKQQIESRLAGLSREQPLIDREIENAVAGMNKLDEESARLTEQKSALADAQADSQTKIDALAGEQKTLADQVRAVAEMLTAARVAIGQLEEKHFAAGQSLTRSQSQRNELGQQIERLARSIASIDSRRDQVAHDLASAEHAGQTLEAQLVELQNRADSLDARLAELVQTVNDLSAQVESTRTEKSDIEAALHKVQIDLSQTTVRIEALVARTSEEVQINLVERYESITSTSPQASADAPALTDAAPPTDPAAPAASLPTAGLDWDAIADEIRALRDRIQRLGNVNLDAINELQLLETEFENTSRQLQDLVSSKQQLEELIAQINQESGVRFEETFAAVRTQFQQMFRKLFGGGKADVILETELEDKLAADPNAAPSADGLPVMKRVDAGTSVLDAGIEIVARPPGKNPVTLSQLSGGEKAMTCIALLMSIFKAKPSPFCILDEVDAPLDEANNVRFGEIVQEFLDTSQFIIITHHKRTMQIGNALYGITQQEQGVSTRVPVRFDQVDANGRIKAEAIVAA